MFKERKKERKKERNKERNLSGSKKDRLRKKVG